MINTGCPLGDASSFLVRVGEYARVSVVLFHCTARISWLFKEAADPTLQTRVYMVTFAHMEIHFYSRHR